MARATEWQDTLISQTVVSAGQTVFSLMGDIAQREQRGLTVIRTLIRLSTHSSSIAGAYGVQLLDIGIGVTSQEAFTAGIVPDPATALDKPRLGWVYRTRHAVSQNGIGSVVMHDLVADVRGARKVDNGELFCIFQNGSSTGTDFSTVTQGIIRCLFKLP